MEPAREIRRSCPTSRALMRWRGRTDEPERVVHGGRGSEHPFPGTHAIRYESVNKTQRNPVSSSSMVDDASLKADGVTRAKGLVKAPPLSS